MVSFPTSVASTPRVTTAFAESRNLRNPEMKKGAMRSKWDGELKGGKKNPGSGRAATRWRLNELQTRKGGNNVMMGWMPSEHRRSSSMGSAEGGAERCSSGVVCALGHDDGGVGRLGAAAFVVQGGEE